MPSECAFGSVPGGVAALKTVACIASTESLGRAGLAVDLRACAALGVHGAPVVVAVTTQVPGRPVACSTIPVDQVLAQVEPVLSDPRLAAVKIGLVPALDVATALAHRLRGIGVPVVLDPVRSGSRGHHFLDDDAWREAMHTLMAVCSLLTPNLPELSALCGRAIADRDAELVEAARSLPLCRGAAVLVKGGHRSGDADDLLVGPTGQRSYSGDRIEGEFRGSGCALSSSIAALLARGRDLEAAVAEAREFLRAALLDAQADGDWRLPHLFWEYYGSEGLP